MDCPACGTEVVAFSVPSAARNYAPDGASAAGLCPACLTLTAVSGGTADVPDAGDADFSRVIEAFPDGETGATMAVAVGLLVDSLVLNRDAITELFERVSDAGQDPWLVLERLQVAGTVQPDADLAKARHQLEQLLG